MSESTIPVLDAPAASVATEVPPRTRRIVKRRLVKRSYHKREATDAGQHGVGRTADQTAQASAVREDRPPEELRRITRDEREMERFNVPEHRKKPGWDYKWEVYQIYNQPVDGAVLRETFDAAWRAERAKDWPELVMPGTAPDATVEQYGQRLYGRPMRFTLEARHEDYTRANRQLADRAHGAQEGRVANGGEGLADMGRVVRPVPLGITVEGEIGSYSGRGRSG